MQEAVAELSDSSRRNGMESLSSALEPTRHLVNRSGQVLAVLERTDLRAEDAASSAKLTDAESDGFTCECHIQLFSERR